MIFYFENDTLKKQVKEAEAIVESIFKKDNIYNYFEEFYILFKISTGTIIHDMNTKTTGNNTKIDGYSYLCTNNDNDINYTNLLKKANDNNKRIVIFIKPYNDRFLDKAKLIEKIKNNLLLDHYGFTIEELD